MNYKLKALAKECTYNNLMVVTPENMKAMDEKTIAGGKSGLDLMEEAGVQCAKTIMEENPFIFDGGPLDYHHPYALILCGGGNNGGDGLVIARQLANHGGAIKVISTAKEGKMTASTTANLNRLIEETGVTPLYWSQLSKEERNALFEGTLCVVDALFGNGLSNRPLDKEMKALINRCNEAADCGATVYAIDIPSGLVGSSGLNVGAAVRATKTLAIEAVKIGCLLGDGPDHSGEITVLDIGIKSDEHTGDIKALSFSDFNFPEPRRKNSHKYSYGAVASVAGSRGMYGAGILSSMASLRVGAGLVTAYVPEEDFDNYAIKAPVEMMVRCYGHDFLAGEFEKQRKNAVLFGPGIGRSRDYRPFLHYILAQDTPIIVDADGLWHLAKELNDLADHRAPLVLTPHLGELSILTGLSVEAIKANLLEIGRGFAQKYKVVLVIKGYNTLIIAPNGKVWINLTGNPGMATAGCGDVLAGMIAGILARGIKAPRAACAAVFYHGLAGDAYVRKHSEGSLIASDLLCELKDILHEAI